MTFEEFKRSTILSPVSQLTDFFLVAGDIQATLCMWSKSMHSQILSIFSEEAGKFKQFSAARNMKITLQRRYKNAVVDSSRQKQLEIFLGRRVFKHFPSATIHPLLVSAQAADVVEVCIYLGEPCNVCELLLTFAHGGDDTIFPSTVDLRTGGYLDGLKLVLEVQIWASNKIDKEERSCTGKWDMQSLLTSSSELFGPERSFKDGKVPRHVKFAFRNPVCCRIIWITLRLPRIGSNSVNLERDFNLLSIDENPFAQVSRRASFGGEFDSDPCIHARRVLVVGRTVRKEIGVPPQGSDQINVRNWLERPPQLNRFKVPIEVERLIHNDLVLEQFLSPASPMLSGFRLDGFSAIKHRVNHSPSTGHLDIENRDCLLEERLTSPAVLFIQVSALQENHNMITVAEYRLPEVKPGTAMYFDFPRQVTTRRVKFRLLGDIAAFSDGPSEQDDSDYRGHPCASGLSLANRIKLYYYADPYELGKWASLSAV